MGACAPPPQMQNSETDLIENSPEPRTTSNPLFAGFLRSEARFPDRPALEVAGAQLSYDELGKRARRIAATLAAHTPAGGAPLVAVFAYRSVTAFAGVLGALLRGHGYVALNQQFPAQRTREMLERCDARALIVDSSSAEQLDEVLAGNPHTLLLVLPEHDDVTDVAARFPQHVVLGASDLGPASDWREPVVDPTDLAYLIFTSGSTGTPKAVMVPHRCVRTYVELMAEHWGVTAEDRFSQTFDMTFDLSVSDMFVAWERGACVCCPSPQQVVMPKAFINDARLTVWYAVPSAGLVMKRLGMLEPSSYPSLRLVLFCGEALPLELARAWSSAAPNANVENVYGPTEVTITCAAYAWDPKTSPAECELGVVPIGRFSAGTEAVVLGEDGLEVGHGEEGELYLAGAQVTPGYWRDAERTAAAFFVPPGRSELHYKTGDRVRRPVGDGPMTYLGRVDFQVKISGHRVELGEIEAVLREETGCDQVVAIGWPKTETGYAAVTAFVCAEHVDSPAVRTRMLGRLPHYMVPREVHAVTEMPLNANGKVDRQALLERLGVAVTRGAVEGAV